MASLLFEINTILFFFTLNALNKSNPSLARLSFKYAKLRFFLIMPLTLHFI